MEKSEIFEIAIRELTEAAIEKRREALDDSEQRLYTEVKALSSQANQIVKSLPEDQQKILTDYFEKTNLIADHECQHLYVQGAKDLCGVAQKAGCAVGNIGRRSLRERRPFYILVVKFGSGGGIIIFKLQIKR